MVAHRVLKPGGSLVAGFWDLTFAQTLFGNMLEMQEPDPVRQGYGEGSFISTVSPEARFIILIR